MTRLSYGIDFGTTNSTIAVVGEAGTPQTISIDREAKTPSVMRSIIYVGTDGAFLYGQSAIDAYLKDVREGKGRIKKTIYTGRFITVTGDADIHGVRPDEVVEELIEFDEFQGGRMLQSLKSVLANPAISSINLFGQMHPIEAVIGGFLKEIKDRADKILEQKGESVMLGRPVRYSGSDEELALTRMRKAAKLAGFREIEFEYEPIAAAYDFGRRNSKKLTALIFDFGGGTLDISIVRFPDKKVLANVGLPIGGDYFNSKLFSSKVARFLGSETTYGPNKAFMPSYLYRALCDWYTATLLKDEHFDEQMDHFRFMSSDPESIDALRSLVNNNLSFSLYDEIDAVKRSLSEKADEVLSFKADDIDIRTKITRKELEEMIAEDLVRINQLLTDALRNAHLSEEQIDVVSTTGGSSLIPVVRSLLIHKFGASKIIPNDAFTSVAAGLAIRATEVFS